ncbi:hypothetical protein CYMTET_27006 [Cymbomonas tetramitiformis]|uniref:UBX domain-containing protein n=1 Tax=Cymbomonas tetramitiformis TaxID=36881 RepID=A0AAE0KXK8_9CHLO|nr:hypothetical protein CYMTET_27006 [Cymbomonas tetramitiformis]
MDTAERQKLEEERRIRAQQLAKQREQEKRDKQRILDQIKEDQDERRRKGKVVPSAAAPDTRAPKAGSDSQADILVQMPNGERKKVQLPNAATVLQLQELVREQLPAEFQAVPFTLLNRTIFPPKALADTAATLQEASLTPNGQVVVQLDTAKGQVTQGKATKGSGHAAGSRKHDAHCCSDEEDEEDEEDEDAPVVPTQPVKAKRVDIDENLHGFLNLNVPYNMAGKSFSSTGLTVLVGEPVSGGASGLEQAAQAALIPALAKSLPLCTFRLELPVLRWLGIHDILDGELASGIEQLWGSADGIKAGDTVLYRNAEGHVDMCKVTAVDTSLSPHAYSVDVKGYPRDTELSHLAPLSTAVQSVLTEPLASGPCLSREQVQIAAEEGVMKMLQYWFAQGAELAGLVGVGGAADVVLRCASHLNTTRKCQVPRLVAISGRYAILPKDVASATATPNGCRLLSVHNESDPQVSCGEVRSFCNAMPKDSHTLHTISSPGTLTRWFIGPAATELNNVVSDFLRGVRRLGAAPGGAMPGSAAPANPEPME